MNVGNKTVTKIDRDQAIAMILESHKNFTLDWEKHLDFWEGEVPGITNDFSTYAIYVRELVTNGNEIELELATQLIERFIKDGDDKVQYGATIGFLEDVTNMLSHKDSKYALMFTKHLKPKSREFCKELDKFWGTSTPGL